MTNSNNSTTLKWVYSQIKLLTIVQPYTICLTIRFSKWNQKRFDFCHTIFAININMMSLVIFFQQNGLIALSKNQIKVRFSPINWLNKISYMFYMLKCIFESKHHGMINSLPFKSKSKKFFVKWLFLHLFSCMIYYLRNMHFRLFKMRPQSFFYRHCYYYYKSLFQ